MRPSTTRGRLFRKYVTLFVLAVGATLLASGVMEIWISYRDHTASLVRIQHEQAEAAASKIDQFIREIQAQIGWTTLLSWSDYPQSEQRFDALRLLRLVPAITELARIDPSGHEQLHVSRLTATVLRARRRGRRAPTPPRVRAREPKIAGWIAAETPMDRGCA